ncbi:MAG: hypothetical protein QNJ44_02605 [Rhodobacter sp.]|nr:hypothetical protein [Rhodobacter sp.]
MGEFAGLHPLWGVGGLPLRQQTDMPHPAVPPVEASVRGQGLDPRPQTAAQPDTRFARHQKGDGSERAPADPAHKQPLDSNTLTGPPPAFQTTVLELEQDLRRAMALIEAARNGPRTEAAIAAASQPSPDGTGAKRTAETDPEPADAHRTLGAEPEPVAQDAASKGAAAHSFDG